MTTTTSTETTTTAETTTSPAQIVAGYLACWNETDDARRRSHIDATWAEQARSVDPVADVTGRDAIDAMMRSTQEQFPGCRFSLQGAVAAHHDVVFWHWSMTAADGSTLVNGTDTAVTEDGRIAVLTGFFDQ